MSGSGRSDSESPGVRIRSIDPSDADDIARLVEMTGEGLSLQYWRGLRLPGEAGWYPALGPLVETAGGGWRSAVVIETAGRLAGLLVFHTAGTGPKASHVLPDAVRPYQALEELVPGAVSVSILSIYPRFRRQGLARALLEHARDKAGGRSLAAVVHASDEPVQGLMRGAGFHLRARLVLEAGMAGETAGTWLLLVRPAGTR